MRGLAAAAAAVVLGAALVGLAVVASAVSFLGGSDSEPAASSTATADIPPAMLALYQQAAATCPGLPWTVLAAIGTVESDNGQSDLPGVHSGRQRGGRGGTDAVRARHVRGLRRGPSRPAGPRRPARTTRPTPCTRRRRLLCANGASGGPNLSGAVYTYNHSNAYVTRCCRWPSPTRRPDPGAGRRSTPVRGRGGCAAVAWALSQIGTPYVWGAGPPASASTAPAWSRPPGPRPASRCPAWPRPSTTPAPAGRRRLAPARGPGLLRRRPLEHRPRRPLRRRRRRRDGHGRRALHGSRRPSGAVPCRHRQHFRQLDLRRARPVQPAP